MPTNARIKAVAVAVAATADALSKPTAARHARAKRAVAIAARAMKLRALAAPPPFKRISNKEIADHVAIYNNSGIPGNFYDQKTAFSDWRNDQAKMIEQAMKLLLPSGAKGFIGNVVFDVKGGAQGMWDRADRGADDLKKMISVLEKAPLPGAEKLGISMSTQKEVAQLLRPVAEAVQEFSDQIDAEYERIVPLMEKAAQQQMSARAVKASQRLVDTIEPGDIVTIVDARGTQRRGRATMKSTKFDGWVLNMGGRFGKPGIASDENVISVKKSKASASAR